MFERLSANPGSLRTLIVVPLLAAAVVAGALSATGPVPWALILASAVAILAVVALWPFGREAPLLAILAITPLFPVTTLGPLTEALGGRGSMLRAGFIGVMVVCLFIAHGGRIPRPPRRLQPLVSGLLVLAGLGVVAAAANAGDNEGFPGLALQLAGQPLIFAAVLIAMASYLRDGDRARDRMLTAFSIGVILQAGIIAVELITGAAYDELRGFTRAQGTVGADFVGAFGMVGFLIGFAELARSPRLRWIGLATIAAGSVILVGAVARGAVIGVLVGGAYILLSDPRLRPRALGVAALVAALAAASLLTPVGALWTDRLNADSVDSFDRPATWVSGARIALDHPWTGLAELDIEEGLVDVREYRQTPFGDTRVLPHNSWLIVADQGGFAALGVIVLLTVLAVLAVRGPPQGRTPEERVYVGALLAMAAVAVINNVVRHPELMIPVIMLICLIACRPQSSGTGSEAAP